MTVSQQRQLMEELEESGYGEVEIEVCYQPNWPLMGTLKGVIQPEDVDKGDPYEEEDSDEDVEDRIARMEQLVENPRVILIVSDSRRWMGSKEVNPYGSKCWWDNCHTS